MTTTHYPAVSGFPPLPAATFSLADVQTYVRAWPAPHILATKQPNDGLLECSVVWKYRDQVARVEVVKAVRPAEEGPLYLLRLNDKMYVLPRNLQYVQQVFEQFPAPIMSKEHWVKHWQNIEALKGLES